jgi:hypothetical protein
VAIFFQEASTRVTVELDDEQAEEEEEEEEQGAYYEEGQEIGEQEGDEEWENGEAEDGY